MKSDEIIRHYVHHDEPAPRETWKRLLWMAAELVRRAQHERHTYRATRREKLPSELSTCQQASQPQIQQPNNQTIKP